MKNSLDLAADFLVFLYGLNRRTLKLRGGYRVLRAASRCLPKLRAYPIHFPETEVVMADVNDPDTYWLLNAFVNSLHPSMAYMHQMIEAAIKPGDVVWDVGANMGWQAWRFGQARYGLRAMHLFEPHPVPYKIANEFLKNHRVAHLHNLGLGNTEGVLNLFCKVDGSTGNASMQHIPDSDSNFIQIECNVERGDDLIRKKGIDAPDFIKIDVEGFEPAVIEGLDDTIKAKKPAICFEITFLSDTQIESLVPPDYKIAYLDSNACRLVTDLTAGRARQATDAIMAPAASSFWAKVQSHFAS